MNKKIKKLWINALRSGKYKQTRGKLRYDDTYCCLGVLCDLHRKITKNKWKPDNCPRHYEYFGEKGALPKKVYSWAKITDDNQQALIDLNDNLNATFKKIANYIEEKL